MAGREKIEPGSGMKALRTAFKERAGFDAPPLTSKEFDLFRSLIRTETGISLSPIKRDLLRTRLRKRLVHVGVVTFTDYYAYLRDSDPRGLELMALINSITTNKTDFFREAHHFRFLRDEAFPKVVAAAEQTGRKRLRIWSAACSTGQEPYSIAVSAREFFQRKAGWDISILASDIDSECLKQAANGVYTASQIEDVSLELKKRHFLRGKGTSAGKVAVRPELKQLITFRRINFASEPWPIHTKFDLIFCRNALIYFDREFQETLLRRFLQYLSPDGYLVLGHSENVTWMNELEPLGQTIYRPIARAQSRAVSHSTRKPRVTAKPSVASNDFKADSRSEIQVTRDATRQDAADAATTGLPKHSIVAGEVFASDKAIQISTLLGSCIAVCLFDPSAKVGGMNHFLLPEGSGANSETACYGIHAMELLINEMMKLGGNRSRMVAKLYGGARVMGNCLRESTIGEKNAAFIRQYLTTEGIPILEQKVGGTRPIRVTMSAHSGDVVASELQNAAKVDSIALEEDKIEHASQPRNQQEQITFF